MWCGNDERFAAWRTGFIPAQIIGNDDVWKLHRDHGFGCQIHSHVQSRLTYNPGFLTGAYYDLTIANPDGTSQTINNIPAGNVLTSNGGTLTIASILAGGTYVIPPGVTGSITSAISLATLTPNEIYVGGTATISTLANVLSSSVIHVDGGTATLSSDVVASALSGTTVDLTYGGTFGNGQGLITALSGTTINFGAGGGTFDANTGGSVLNLSSLTINGFNSAKDNIEFSGVTGTVDSYTITNGTGGQTITLKDAGGNTLGTVTVAGTGLPTGTFTHGQSGPLGVTDNTTAGTITINDGGGTVPCFAAGTHVLTPDGEMPVEALRPGMTVLLAHGGEAPVTWVGSRNVDLDRHRAPETMQPVLVEAGAIADGMPRRDLLLSPDHAVWIDGFLIPVKALANGATIRQIARRAVSYYHVELPEHAVLLAEGLPCESYLETGNRNAFTNGGEPVALHPRFAPDADWQAVREALSCAPLVETGPVVEGVRARLLARAAIATTPDAAMTVTRRADGAVVIESRSAVPGLLTRDPRDRRQLGVKVAALHRADGSPIPLDHAALAEGWHDHEIGGRWTNGRAVIPAELAGEGLPRVSIAATIAYPVTGTIEAETRAAG